MDLLVLEYEMNVNNLINELETYNSLEKFMYESGYSFFEDGDSTKAEVHDPNKDKTNNTQPQQSNNANGGTNNNTNNNGTSNPTNGAASNPQATQAEVHDNNSNQTNAKPAGEAEKGASDGGNGTTDSGTNNTNNTTNNNGNTSNNGEEDKEGIISKIIQAIKNFFKQIGDFFSGKASEGDAEAKMRQIEEGLDAHPEVGKETIEIPFFNTKDLKTVCQEYMNGNIPEDEIENYFYDPKKTTKTTVNKAYEFLKENFDVVKNMSESSQIMDTMLRTVTDPKVATGISKLCSNYGKGKGSLLSLIPMIIKIGGAAFVAKKAYDHHHWKNEKVLMKYIQTYTNDGKLLKKKIADAIHEGVLKRKHVNAICAEETFSKAFEGDKYDKKEENRRKWDKQYLDKVADDYNSGQFNKDYLNHLVDVREYVEKTGGFYKGSLVRRGAKAIQSFRGKSDKYIQKYVNDIVRSVNKRGYDPDDKIDDEINFQDKNKNIITCHTKGEVVDAYRKGYKVVAPK